MKRKALKGKSLASKSITPVILGLVLSFCIVTAAAQTNSYQQTNLVSDMAGVANNTDSKLINP